MKQLLVESFTADSMAERGHQVLDRPADCRPGHAAVARLHVAKSLDQALDLAGALLEMGTTFVGNLEWLALPLARRFLDQPHILKEGQRRVNDAGAWRIFAASQFLDGADEVVTVPRLVRDE